VAAYETDSVDIDVPGPNLWWLWVVLGVLSTILGIWLIFSPNAAAYTLAILLAIGLFFNGIGDLVWARDRPRPWVGYVLGALFILGGIVVLARPNVGLKALALVVGIVLIIVGVFQFAAAIVDRDALVHWGWLALLGALTFVAGFLALVWPRVTVFVLALILGIRLTLFGLTQIVIGVNMRKLSS
jgi:uncharacterized membrane protein HdeD (DUF308 family)